MIKTQKVDFDGYGIDYIPNSIDLRAIALTKYHLANESVFAKDNTTFDIAVPIELDIFSKISVVKDDFSIKDIVGERNVEFIVCGCNEHSIIYCEKKENLIFKCTSSKNEYISSSEGVTYEYYDGVFVVEESVDYDNKKVTAFDMDLNVISSCVIDFSEPNKFEIEKLSKKSEFNNYTFELQESYPNLYIDWNFNAFNENTSQYLIAACYDKKSQKEYLVKFNKSKEITWKLELFDSIMTDNILVLENYFYALYHTDKRGNKWRLSKCTNNGKILDNYDFIGGDARLTLYNEKPIVVYKDFSMLTLQQKMILKTTGEYIGPAAMIIVE